MPKVNPWVLFMYKIVIDTNLLIDGSSDDYNYGNRIIDEVIGGKLEAYANRASLRENQFIAARKISDETYLKKLNDFFAKINPAPDELRLKVVEDNEDNKILASAVGVNADFLITSDWHLLKLGEYEGVRIVNPTQFWSEYSQESGSGWKDWMGKFIN